MFALLRADARYPRALETFLRRAAPKQLTCVGNLDLLAEKSLALFCSNRCPGNLILKTYDLAVELRDAHIPVIGGFHTPMERECLRILLRGKQPVILCFARNLGTRQILEEYRAPIQEGRLLLFSPFDAKHSRITAGTSAYRNRVIAALAANIFVAYAAPNGKTEQFCREIAAWGKPFFTFGDVANQNLVMLGARSLLTSEISKISEVFGSLVQSPP